MSEETTGEEAKGKEAKGEDELRAELEDEIRKVRVEDVLLQSVISVLNLSARRIAKDDERDLEQAKLGIDASRAVVEFLPGEAQNQVREALSELQLLYAKHASGGDEPAGGDPDPAAPDAGTPKSGQDAPGLWTPPGS